MHSRTDLVADIQIHRLRTNIRNFQQHISPADIMGVVKANAYGHGAVRIAATLVEENVPMLAVAVVEEAIELRESGIQTPILVLGKIWPEQVEAVLNQNLEVLVASMDDYRLLAEKSQQAGSALRIHLKIDTGMGRLGFLTEEVKAMLDMLKDAKNLNLTGVMSHLATADEPDRKFTGEQIHTFREMQTQVLTAFPDNPPMFHLANSGAALFYPEARFDSVRLGLSMYGMPPAANQPLPFPIEELMQLKSKVAYVKRFPEHFPIGYGNTYRTKKDSTILVCAGGYEDGIPRRYGNTGEVLIHGKRFPIVGNVSMDTFMVDVRTESVSVGEEVVLFGEQDEAHIPIWEMAKKLHEIPYEVTCGISARVPRIYTDTSENVPRIGR